MPFSPLLLPQFHAEPSPLPPRSAWVLPDPPSDLSVQERLDEANTRFFRGFLYLQTVDMALLEDLGRAADEKRPFEVYVDGVEPDLERLFAVLRCAYQWGVAVTVMAGPPPSEVGLRTVEVVVERTPRRPSAKGKAGRPKRSK